MLCIWLVALRLKNAGIVDVAWGLGFIPLALICFCLSNGWLERRVLIMSLIIIWSLRLGGYILVRFIKWFPAEDVRYKHIREKTGEKANGVFLFIFLWQAWLMAFMMAPAIVSGSNHTPSFQLLEFLGTFLWFVGNVGESIADYQLSSFKAKRENNKRNCAVGLWRYSRHPNYFFEWIIWVGFFVFACASPSGWLTAFVPAILLYLLIYITGVKPSEEHSLKVRPQEYMEYQKRTSMFVPWFKLS